MLLKVKTRTIDGVKLIKEVSGVSANFQVSTSKGRAENKGVERLVKNTKNTTHTTQQTEESENAA